MNLDESEVLSKGQLISKADLGVADSPKKRTNEFDFFDMKSKNAKKNPKSYVRFLGESTAHQFVFGFILPLVIF